MKPKNEIERLSLSKLKKNVKKAFFYNTNIIISDNSSLIVENCKHILECNEIMVKILTVDFSVTIWGMGLLLNDYNSSNVEVSGVIKSVEIEPRRREKKDDI